MDSAIAISPRRTRMTLQSRYGMPTTDTPRKNTEIVPRIREPAESGGCSDVKSSSVESEPGLQTEGATVASDHSLETSPIVRPSGTHRISTIPRSNSSCRSNPKSIGLCKGCQSRRLPDSTAARFLSRDGMCSPKRGTRSGQVVSGPRLQPV